MNPLAYLQFFVPKRHAFAHWLYRRMYRAYRWVIRIPETPITMNGTRMCVWLFFGAGPVIVFLFALLTLLIP